MTLFVGGWVGEACESPFTRSLSPLTSLLNYKTYLNIYVEFFSKEIPITMCVIVGKE